MPENRQDSGSLALNHGSNRAGTHRGPSVVAGGLAMDLNILNYQDL